MALFIAVGPYAVLPNVALTEEGDPIPTCAACNDGVKRDGRFCATCGGPVSEQPTTHTKALSHWDLPNDDERFFVLDDQERVLLYNHSSPHVLKLDGDDRGQILPLPAFTPEQSIAWYQNEAAHISAWLAEQGHPPLTFGYGAVVGGF